MAVLSYSDNLLQENCDIFQKKSVDIFETQHKTRLISVWCLSLVRTPTCICILFMIGSKCAQSCAQGQWLSWYYTLLSSCCFQAVNLLVFYFIKYNDYCICKRHFYKKSLSTDIDVYRYSMYKTSNTFMTFIIYYVLRNNYSLSNIFF